MRFNKDLAKHLTKAFCSGVMDSVLNITAGSLILVAIMLYSPIKGSVYDMVMASLALSAIVLISRDWCVIILKGLVKLKRWFWLRKLSKMTPETK